MNYHHEQRRIEKNDPDSSPVSFTELVRGLLADQFVNHRYRLIIGFIALISVDFLQLSIPLLVKKAIDALAAQDATMTKLFIIAGAILAIAISVVALRFVWRMLIIGFSRYLERHLRNRIFSHILSMDQYFFSRRSTGDIMAHGSNDLAAVQMACGMGMVAAVDALVLSVAAIGFMIYIHPTLTLFALLPQVVLGPVIGALVDRWSRRWIMLVSDAAVSLFGSGWTWLACDADGKLDKHEDYLIHKLAGLLRLTHKQLIAAKLKVLGGS